MMTRSDARCNHAKEKINKSEIKYKIGKKGGSRLSL